MRRPTSASQMTCSSSDNASSSTLLRERRCCLTISPARTSGGRELGMDSVTTQGRPRTSTSCRISGRAPVVDAPTGKAATFGASATIPLWADSIEHRPRPDSNGCRWMGVGELYQRRCEVLEPGGTLRRGPERSAEHGPWSGHPGLDQQRLKSMAYKL